MQVWDDLERMLLETKAEWVAASIDCDADVRLHCAGAAAYFRSSVRAPLQRVGL